MKKLLLFSLLLLCLSPAIAHAGPLAGRVIGVADGDTITVLTGNRQIKVRLYGVDCPENRQPYGNRAKQVTSKAAFGKQVDLMIRDKDRYGRSVAVVILPDGGTLQDALLKAGLAWVYDKYCKTQECNSWRKLERKARTDKTGLWTDKKPTPPWAWRGKKRR